ncbi:MAG: DUF2721 domain-containing protein [Planctomycetota bacterium]|nr:DUF2721 domain-containing protein [Planctomycetota bacterium]
MPLSDLIPTLQLSIGPAILISGVGLILLSMTNRFGRVIDRSRLMTRDLREASHEERPRILEQLRILSRRARQIRAGIACGAFSALLAALMIVSLFVGALMRLEIGAVIVGLFLFCVAMLIGSLLCFIAEINASLKALWLEIPAEGQRDQA